MKIVPTIFIHLNPLLSIFINVHFKTICSTTILNFNSKQPWLSAQRKRFPKPNEIPGMRHGRDSISWECQILILLQNARIAALLN